MRTSLDAILDGLGAGTPPNVVLMQLLVEAETVEAAEAALARRAEHDPAVAGLARLLQAHPGAFAAIRSVMREADHAAKGEAGPAHWAAIFDRLAALAPEAGVALYALGSPDLLAAATAELVEIGCGIGRLTVALAPRMADALGLDVSAGMVAEAQRRGDGIGNLRFARSAGRDLGPVATRSVHLVLAADVFPYLVEAGLAAGHVAEAARVLRPGGVLAVFNWSYRGDPARDERDAEAAFAAAGLAAERIGTHHLRLWDAPAFVGRLPG